MRVICIDSEGSKGHLKEGEVYTAEDSHSDCCGNKPSFKILEVKRNTLCTNCGRHQSAPKFNKKRFIPLSEIDELELINEKQLCQ